MIFPGATLIIHSSYEPVLCQAIHAVAHRHWSDWVSGQMEKGKDFFLSIVGVTDVCKYHSLLSTVAV
jgi:hypothetical protein